VSSLDDGGGRRLVAAVKDTARDGVVGLCLRSTNAPVTLRPVGTSPGAASPDDVRALTDWRNRRVSAFLTEFEATPHRTAAWLAGTVGPDPGRIVFTLCDENGDAFGVCGLASVDWATGSLELDGVTRGTTAVPGGMSAGLRTLLGWSLGQLGLSTPRVRVVSDNEHALAFYSRLGFIETHRVPLRRIEEPGLVSWVPDPSGPADARQLVHLRIVAPDPAQVSARR
jgi:RimJ/RimL family protein N-acetyltransferase